MRNLLELFYQKNYPSFQWKIYKELNPDLQFEHSEDFKLHFALFGKNENRPWQTSNYNEISIKKKMLVVIPGLGSPNFEKKLNILQKNIKIFEKEKNIVIHLYICLYDLDQTEQLKEFLKNNCSLHTIIQGKKGIVGEFLRRDLTESFIKNYDFLFFLLDDIELHPNTPFIKMIQIYISNPFHILGFPLTHESPTYHEFMRVKNELLKNSGNSTLVLEVNFLEFFSYFMTPSVFLKYKSTFLNHYTYWLWGIDFALYNAGFRMARIESYPCKHYFAGNSYSKNLPDPNIELQMNTQKFSRITQKKIIHSFFC